MGEHPLRALCGGAVLQGLEFKLPGLLAHGWPRLGFSYQNFLSELDVSGRIETAGAHSSMTKGCVGVTETSLCGDPPWLSRPSCLSPRIPMRCPHWESSVCPQQYAPVLPGLP
jgi:hypothetical protein